MTTFTPPTAPVADGVHHEQAATGNAELAEAASAELAAVLSGHSTMKRILIKAAAGAGKSFVLKRLVSEAAANRGCERAAVVAFTNKQTWPLANSLGAALGSDRVCLLASKNAFPTVPDEVRQAATVVARTGDIPATTAVVIGTCSRLGAPREGTRLREHLGAVGESESPFDALFVDEAWQIPHHLFDKVNRLAPVWVGVGDVGQLPPLEVGENPWRGDAGYNPLRAWPTDYLEDETTWARELPAVWRPAAGHLGLWRAFYPEWAALDCVAAPEDRGLDVGPMPAPFSDVWRQVGTGVPTLLEVDGLEEPEAADIDLPLMGVLEKLLDAYFAARTALTTAGYDRVGALSGTTSRIGPGSDGPDPVVAILATRNQAVDDAADVVDRLREKHGLSEHDLVSSTVDSYQGQTNGITVAIHPLSGATELDSFNSAFGRLAVTCTRATHGLLLLSRPGLDELLSNAPARPGTPFGEPGNRHLPRQTHVRILEAFARGSWNCGR
ncbi:MAG: AAA family ATPase [Cellulomonadaceae bacterium]